MFMRFVFLLLSTVQRPPHADALSCRAVPDRPIDSQMRQMGCSTRQQIAPGRTCALRVRCCPVITSSLGGCRVRDRCLGYISRKSILSSCSSSSTSTSSSASVDTGESGSTQLESFFTDLQRMVSNGTTDLTGNDERADGNVAMTSGSPAAAAEESVSQEELVIACKRYSAGLSATGVSEEAKLMTSLTLAASEAWEAGGRIHRHAMRLGKLRNEWAARLSPQAYLELPKKKRKVFACDPRFEVWFCDELAEYIVALDVQEVMQAMKEGFQPAGGSKTGGQPPGVAAPAAVPLAAAPPVVPKAVDQAEFLDRSSQAQSSTPGSSSDASLGVGFTGSGGGSGPEDSFPGHSALVAGCQLFSTHMGRSDAEEEAKLHLSLLLAGPGHVVTGDDGMTHQHAMLMAGVCMAWTKLLSNKTLSQLPKKKGRVVKGDPRFQVWQSQQHNDLVVALDVAVVMKCLGGDEGQPPGQASTAADATAGTAAAPSAVARKPLFKPLDQAQPEFPDRPALARSLDCGPPFNASLDVGPGPSSGAVSGPLGGSPGTSALVAACKLYSTRLGRADAEEEAKLHLSLLLAGPEHEVTGDDGMIHRHAMTMSKAGMAWMMQLSKQALSQLPKKKVTMFEGDARFKVWRSQQHTDLVVDLDVAVVMNAMQKQQKQQKQMQQQQQQQEQQNQWEQQKQRQEQQERQRREAGATAATASFALDFTDDHVPRYRPLPRTGDAPQVQQQAIQQQAAAADCFGVAGAVDDVQSMLQVLPLSLRQALAPCLHNRLPEGCTLPGSGVDPRVVLGLDAAGGLSLMEVALDAGRDWVLLRFRELDQPLVLRGVQFTMEEAMDALRPDFSPLSEGYGDGSYEDADTQQQQQQQQQQPPPHWGSRGFSSDGRMGLRGTLHRISGARDAQGRVYALTYRLGRHMPGVATIFRDLLAQMCTRHRAPTRADRSAEWQGMDRRAGGLGGVSARTLAEVGRPSAIRSLLLLGPPGVGKTTLLRDVTRLLADEFHKSVAVIDTSNEIAGDAEGPHPCIGSARCFRPHTRDLQHRLMVEVVQNHTPQVVVIDEIGTVQEVRAVRTISQRGVALVGTAHGDSLASLLRNPELSPLVGGLQTVTLGDAEAAASNGGAKTRIERAGSPVFSTLIEILAPNMWRIHWDVAESVDLMLAGRSSGAQQEGRRGGWEQERPHTEVRSYVAQRPDVEAVGGADDGMAVPAHCMEVEFETALAAQRAIEAAAP